MRKGFHRRPETPEKSTQRAAVRTKSAQEVKYRQVKDAKNPQSIGSTLAKPKFKAIHQQQPSPSTNLVFTERS